MLGDKTLRLDTAEMRRNEPGAGPGMPPIVMPNGMPGFPGPPGMPPPFPPYRDFPPRDFPPRDFPPRFPPRDFPPRDFPPRDFPPPRDFRDLPPRDFRDLPPRDFRDLPPRLPPRDLPPRDRSPFSPRGPPFDRDLPPRDLPPRLPPRDFDRFDLPPRFPPRDPYGYPRDLGRDDFAYRRGDDFDYRRYRPLSPPPPAYRTAGYGGDRGDERRPRSPAPALADDPTKAKFDFPDRSAEPAMDYSSLRESYRAAALRAEPEAGKAGETELQ